MFDIGKIVNIPGTYLVFAACHFPLEEPNFYACWALHALELEIVSPSIVQLATIDREKWAYEIPRLVSLMLAEIGVCEISRTVAAKLYIFEVLRTLPGDLLSCWDRLQNLRLMNDVPAELDSIYREFERLDLEFGRAGEDGALFETVVEGIRQFRLSAELFCARSIVRLDKLEDGTCMIEIFTPTVLMEK